MLLSFHLQLVTSVGYTGAPAPARVWSPWGFPGLSSHRSTPQEVAQRRGGEGRSRPEWRVRFVATLVPKFNGIWWNIIPYKWDIHGILMRYNGWIWGFPQSWGIPKMRGFLLEKIPLKWMIRGYPYFRKPLNGEMDVANENFLYPIKWYCIISGEWMEMVWNGGKSTYD